MSTIDEKRVFDDRRGARTAYVAGAIGLVAVSTSGASVGEFGLVHRGEVRDVCLDPETLVLATPTDVVVRRGDRVHVGGGPDTIGRDEDETGFGPAVTVGLDGAGRPLAADEDGHVARYTDGWATLGAVPTSVRAIGRGHVTSADGVRALENLGAVALDDARDLADPGPVVATGAGVFRAVPVSDGETRDGAHSERIRESAADGQDWRLERDGTADRVAASEERSAIVSGGTVFTNDDGTWRRALGTREVRDLAIAGDRLYAVTADGELFVEDGEGWRSRSIGLADVTGLAVT